MIWPIEKKKSVWVTSDTRTAKRGLQVSPPPPPPPQNTTNTNEVFRSDSILRDIDRTDNTQFTLAATMVPPIQNYAQSINYSPAENTPTTSQKNINNNNSNVNSIDVHN